MGPPSLGTMRVVLATMDSFPWREEQAVSDSFPSAALEAGPCNTTNYFKSHSPCGEHRTCSTVEPMERVFFCGAGGPSVNCREER